MKNIRRLHLTLAVATTLGGAMPRAAAVVGNQVLPATGWVVTNWASGDPTTVVVTGANTNSPSFSEGAGLAMVAAVPATTLGDGQFVKTTGTLNVANAQPIATGYLIQFRIGLFEESGAGPSVGDGTGYTGFTVENYGQLKETAGATNPFSTPGSFVIPGLAPDPEGDVLVGNSFAVQFELMMTRDGNQLDISGNITDGGAYRQDFSVEDYLPLLTSFSFNRVGFLAGGFAGAETVSLSNVVISRPVPEPGLAAWSVAALAIGMRFNRGGRRRSREQIRHQD